MIRPCCDKDFDEILDVINDGAIAYRGVIPADMRHEPYMSATAGALWQLVIPAIAINNRYMIRRNR